MSHVRERHEKAAWGRGAGERAAELARLEGSAPVTLYTVTRDGAVLCWRHFAASRELLDQGSDLPDQELAEAHEGNPGARFQGCLQILPLAPSSNYSFLPSALLHERISSKIVAHGAAVPRALLSSFSECRSVRSLRLRLGDFVAPSLWYMRAGFVTYRCVRAQL